ncbi:hypothetical protein [Pseudoduganella armeniaca]|uniref:Uncharacterized protein n=1 Tax=Pseudoduganella armeniaca TaxID=2072590 RepID=A0A2R4CAG2_9BURK|nr:hypothetical protein [Pseudoduganella armeniaca]AVR96629.1 hypothetical protein C9I28_13700 [Pseudoduganella armeniaca]
MNESLHMYVTGSTVQLRRVAGPPWRRRLDDIGAKPWRPAEPASLGLQLAPAARRFKRDLHVHVGAALCRLGVFELPAGVRGTGEAEAVGCARLRHELGLDTAQWRLRAQVIPRRGIAVAAAMATQAVDAVAAFAATHDLRVVTLRPFAMGLWNCVQARQASGAARTFVAVEPDALTVLRWSEGTLREAYSMQHAGDAGLLQREARRLALQGDSRDTLALLAHRDGAWDLSGLDGVLLPARGYLQRSRYADFRELMFAAEAP